MNLARDAAILYANRGLYVLPLLFRKKQPDGMLVPKGFHEATCFYDKIFEWWRLSPNANVGIACAPSGLVVLDYDPREDEDSIMEAKRKYGPLPITAAASTQSGGIHYLFKRPLGASFKKVLLPGLDIKCNGYIVAPPSRVEGEYIWLTDPETSRIVELPETWLRAMEAETSHPRTKSRGYSLEAGTDDPIRDIPAEEYVPRLTGREVFEGGWVVCPFHKNGRERTPSLLCNGKLWCCYACEPPAGKSALGGNIFDLQGALMGFNIPLSRTSYGVARREVEKILGSSAPQKSLTT